MTDIDQLRLAAIARLQAGGDPLTMWRAVGMLCDEAKAALYAAGNTSANNGVYAYSSMIEAEFVATERTVATGIRHEIRAVGDRWRVVKVET